MMDLESCKNKGDEPPMERRGAWHQREQHTCSWQGDWCLLERLGQKSLLVQSGYGQGRDTGQDVLLMNRLDGVFGGSRVRK